MVADSTFVSVDVQYGQIFTREFFQECIPTGVEVLDSRVVSSPSGPLVLAQKYAPTSSHPIGMFPYEWTIREAGRERTQQIIVKSKPSAAGFARTVGELLTAQGVVVDDIEDLIAVSDLAMPDVREVQMYRILARAAETRALAPAMLGSYLDPRANFFVLVLPVMEADWLTPEVGDLARWGTSQRQAVMRQLGTLHGYFLSRSSEVPDVSEAPTAMSAPRMLGLRPLWEGLAHHARHSVGSVLSRGAYSDLHRCVADTGIRWEEIDASPRTVVHGDCQVKNIALPPSRPPLLYDWEVSTMHLPARDGVEFLVSSSPLEIADDEIHGLVELHRQMVGHVSGHHQPLDEWWRQYLLAAEDYQATRFSLYLAIEDIESHDIVRGQQVLTRLMKLARQKSGS